MSRQVAVAEAFGLQNAAAIEQAAERAGLPFHVACALIQKESMGRNIYGHDEGGAGPHGQPVTRANFGRFLEDVLAGATSNGVGPAQITYAGPRRADGTRDGGFFTAMSDRGLRAWVPVDNMRFGFELLAGYHRATGSWVGAGERYNGARSYGEDLARKVGEWRVRLAPTPLRVASLNLGAGPWAKKAADLDKLAARVDVIGLQEASDRRGDLTVWCQRNGWMYHIGDATLGAAAVPILVGPNVDLLRNVSHEAVPPTFVGNPGAGPATIKRKVVNRVKVRVGDDVHHVLNTHFTPSTSRRGLVNWVRRMNHYRRHAAALVRVVDARHGTVTVVGDFNADPGFVLLRGLRSRLTQVVDEDTLGKRLIDHIWTNGRARGVEAIPTSSDHDAAVATIHQHKEK